jgi:predicted Zn-ribbon and HTH transcriptional regulator
MSDERSQTLRKAIAHALEDGPLTAREISERVGLPEREVAAHLAHLERTLKNAGQTLTVLPARCVACGFAFTKRDKKTRPSRCPECKSERLEPPRFGVRR